MKQSKKIQQRRPLFNALEHHLQQEKTSFHVPGHKNGLNWPAESFMKKVLPFDQTEVSGLDYLHEAESVLKESQDLLSELYGSKQSYYLVNGSTGGNLAMITGALAKEDTVLVDRTSHQSIMHALELAEAKPVFLLPDYDAGKKDTVALTLSIVQQAIEKHYPVKALILTYPSYNGQSIMQIKDIIDYCHQQGVVVLVDEAHGPHFTLGAPFPASALDVEADVVVHSAHKMLPAMTQTGYLHIGKTLPAQMHQKIERQLHILQSSSPSYILMQSLEYARYFLAHFSESDLERTLAYRDQWVDVFQQQGLHFWQSDDPLKGRLHWSRHSGSELAQELETQGLYPEKYDQDSVLLTFPLLKKDTANVIDSKKFYLSEKASALEMPECPQDLLLAIESITELQMSYTEQKNAPVEKIALQDAVGKIAAQNITPYPPGIPLVLKGQAIVPATLKRLENYLQEGYRIVGINAERKVSVYK